MDLQLAREVIACLPRDKTVFAYYKDRYAVMLLEKLAGDGIPIAKIKATRFSRLLNRPVVHGAIARKGSGVLTSTDLAYANPQTGHEYYVLTLGLWGGSGNCAWDQTSRKGVNLVLQLNFSEQHDRHLVALFDKKERGWFSYAGHPVCRQGRNTLAWARLDIDFDADAALIEEVQTDWLRSAKSLAASYAHAARQGTPGERRNAQRFVDYHDNVLRPHQRLWSEAMLTAALWFLIEEIGISTVWFHDAVTGARLKRIKHTKPPRSLYTDLPRQFCFERVASAPPFIGHDAPRKIRRAIKTDALRFWRLGL